MLMTDLYSSRCMHDPSFMALARKPFEKMTKVWPGYENTKVWPDYVDSSMFIIPVFWTPTDIWCLTMFVVIPVCQSYTSVNNISQVHRMKEMSRRQN